MSEYQLVDTEETLSICFNELKDSIWFAVDTEFERVNTYYPKLCLIQIANLKKTFIIDPIKLNDIDAIYTLLYDESITKVLHSAHQDIEIFFNIMDKIPSPLFDTQIASPLFGFNRGIGYANLINDALNIGLDKSQSRTDWTKRPLTDAQLRYAADDVIYLARVYHHFVSLITDSISEELIKSFAVLYLPETYRPNPEDMWKKIFAVRRLKGKSLTIAKKLAAWREVTARKNNIPRKWVLSNQALVELAKQMPVKIADVLTVKEIKQKDAKRYAEEWLAIIAGVNT